MSVAHRISQDRQRIIHALVYIYIVNRSLFNTVVSQPVTKWLLSGEAIGRSERQSFFLTGGAATPTSAAYTAVLQGSLQTGGILRATFHKIPIGTDVDDVVCEVDMQAGDAITDALADLRNVINVAQAGTGTPTNGRFYCTNNVNANVDQIEAGLEARFATPLASGTSPNITFTALEALGLEGNEQTITLEVLPKAATLLTLGSVDNVASIAGIYGAGYTNGAQYQATAAENEIDTDQDLESVDSYVTTLSSTLTLNLFQVTDPNAIRLASSYAGLSSADSYDLTYPNHRATPAEVGLILQYESQRVLGQQNLVMVDTVSSAALQVALGKTHAPSPVSLKVKKSQGRLPIIFADYRPSFNG